MVNSGELAELVNANKVTFTNQTDSADYGQLYNLSWSSLTPQVKKAKTDGTRDSLDRVPDLSIDADIWITQPEVTTFIALHKRTGTPPQTPTKNWDLGITAEDLSTDTVRLVGKMNGLSFLAPENGGAWFHITVTSTTGEMSEP